jgi:hypothetical protein
MFAALIIATVLDLSLALPPSSVSGSFCMCKISTAVALCLGYVGISGTSGPLSWSAVALHAILSALLGWNWLSGAQRPSRYEGHKVSS